MKVMHVEAGLNLYGGAFQVKSLMEGLAERDVENVLVCPHGAAIGQQLRYGTADVREITLTGDLDVGAVGRIARVIRSERPDIVHLHSRRGADVMGGLAARRCGIASVHSRRNENPEPRWLARWKYGLFDRIVTISDAIRRSVLSYGVPASKVVMIHSAYELPADLVVATPAQLCERFALPPDSFVIGVIAQLIKRKGHRFLIEALPATIRQYSNVQVLFFGQGGERDALQTQINAAGLGAHIHIVGFHKDVLHWMGALDLVVHPAVMEGLGVSLLQASSLGVSIIASRAGGIPEAVRDGLNGHLVPPGDVPALTAELLRLIPDAELRQRFGAAGRKFVAEEFSYARMVDANLAVYEQVLREHGHSARDA